MFFIRFEEHVTILINFIDQLMNLSTKTFYITPAINKKIGYCKKNIDNSILNLEQRKIRTAQGEQTKILSYEKNIFTSSSSFYHINCYRPMQWTLSN